MEEDEIELVANEVEVDVQETCLVVNPMNTVGGRPVGVS